ncbi:hypothetical protein PV328_005306 [Microctonus aethiopoides]|uniref:C2H2-type domain-containing protein n=1 Tax=Microctonus aethiopoides TaxID=144406 RepID=A0AA39FLV0_9HYME|nr:hypothetical protein PV328_005306 [Microctonus aethiopoides]
MSSQNVTVNDPISKAVMENIMGTLPTKKPLVKCNDCELCFTSQTVLEAHLQGSRHAKQIRSKVIMATLEETKVAFTKDQEANGLKCNVCNVCLNSIQQLQTHLNGNRHKKKIMKGNISKELQMAHKRKTFENRMFLVRNRSYAVLINCFILFNFACMIMLMMFIHNSCMR